MLSVPHAVNLQSSSACAASVYANPVILLISFAHMPSSQLNPWKAIAYNWAQLSKRQSVTGGGWTPLTWKEFLSSLRKETPSRSKRKVSLQYSTDKPVIQMPEPLESTIKKESQALSLHEHNFSLCLNKGVSKCTYFCLHVCLKTLKHSN